MQRGRFRGPEGEDDGVIFNGVFDRAIRHFHQGIQRLAKRDVLQGRNQPDGRLRDIEIQAGTITRCRKTGRRIDCRRSLWNGVNIIADDEIQSLLFNITRLRILAD